MEVQENKNLEEINKKLDLIVGLLLRLLTKENKQASFREQVFILHDLGVGSGEIAKILNRDVRNVSKYLSQLKKSRGKKTKKEYETEKK